MILFQEWFGKFGIFIYLLYMVIGCDGVVCGEIEGLGLMEEFEQEFIYMIDEVLVGDDV